MKILMVNKFLYYNGGSETYIFELGKALNQKGHEVQYFGMEHPDRVVGNNAGAYTSNMDFHTDSIISKLVAPFKIIYSVEARRKIRRVLEEYQPDIVHLNNINFQITPSIIYEIRAWEKKNKKVKIIFTAHDYQWICPNHMLYIPQRREVCDRCIGGKFAECAKNNCIHESKLRSILGAVEGYYYKLRKTYGLVDVIICPSQFLYDKFATDELLRDKLVMMHNFVNSELTARTSTSSVNNPYIIYFGRYDVQKGITTLINVCKRNPDIRFIFAGRGPLEDEVNKVENIENVGFKSGNELTTLISAAAFSIYPSEWYENCPFSVMESQVYNTPVIGSDIGGIPELICTDISKATGTLFEPGNADELEEAIRKLWSDKTLLTEYTNNCKNCNFEDVDSYTENLLKLYSKNECDSRIGI